jgi:hypothetical protein
MEIHSIFPEQKSGFNDVGYMCPRFADIDMALDNKLRIL